MRLTITVTGLRRDCQAVLFRRVVSVPEWTRPGWTVMPLPGGEILEVEAA